MPKREPQIHMDESVIFNSDLEAVIESYLEYQQAHRLFESAKKVLKAYVKGNDLEPGLYRVGPYTFMVTALAGGGFQMPAWDAKGVKINK